MQSFSCVGFNIISSRIWMELWEEDINALSCYYIINSITYFGADHYFLPSMLLLHCNASELTALWTTVGVETVDTVFVNTAGGWFIGCPSELLVGNGGKSWVSPDNLSTCDFRWENSWWSTSASAVSCPTVHIWGQR